MVPRFCRSVLIVFVLSFVHEGRPFLGSVWKASTLMRCLFSSDSTLSELTSYTPGGNVSDNMLCFLKCVLEGYELLDDGKIVTEKFEDANVLPSVPHDLSRNLRGCLDGISEGMTVVECRDLIPMRGCLEEFYAEYQSGTQ